MSDTMISAGQVFTGGATVGVGDAGTIALTQVGSIDFNIAVSPPTITDVASDRDRAKPRAACSGSERPSAIIRRTRRAR